jgi:hypothetical protein
VAGPSTAKALYQPNRSPRYAATTSTKATDEANSFSAYASAVKVRDPAVGAGD